MSDWTEGGGASPPQARISGAIDGSETRRPLPWTAQYAASLGLVTAATLVAFVVGRLIAAPNITLIYVLPVVVAATMLGWGPALVAAIASVLAFDFFFTQPYYSFAIANASDVWEATLLLVTAAIVSTVAGDARRRAVESRRAAAQAQALQGLAHKVIESRPKDQIVAAGAEALSQIFEAPVLIFMDGDDGPQLAASAGGAKVTRADEDAAEGVLREGIRTRGEAYPYDKTEYDFWPLASASGRHCALGVNFKRSVLERPADPDRWVDVVKAYLATALAR
jgi:K+-sensing histidine kinase KdpD